MAEPPGPVARLEEYLRAATIAHEVIWELYTELIVRGCDDRHSHAALREAARIATLEIPRALAEPRRLRDLWTEQDLLDPVAASKTLGLLADELIKVERDVRRMRARQDEIARELRRVAQDPP